MTMGIVPNFIVTPFSPLFADHSSSANKPAPPPLRFPSHLTYEGIASPSLKFGVHTLPNGMNMRFGVVGPARGAQRTMVLVLGKSGFIEKCESSTLREYTDRGFRVFIPELPNQGKSSRVFSTRDHVDDFDLYVSSFNSFFDKVVKQNKIGPTLISAHSLGSIVVGHWAADQKNLKERVPAMILEAPMFQFTCPPLKAIMQDHARRLLGREPPADQPRATPPAYAKYLANIMVATGFGKTYALGEGDYDPSAHPFDNNPHTRNKRYHDHVKQQWAVDPKLVIGGVTWGWFCAALDAVERLQKPGRLERIETSVLAFIGNKDKYTPFDSNAKLVGRIPNATIVPINGALHDLMGERGLPDVREKISRHTNQFLRRVPGF